MEFIGLLCFAAGVTGLISPRLIRLPGRGAASGVLVLGLVLLAVGSGGGPEPSSTASAPGSSSTASASPSVTASPSTTSSSSSRAALTNPGPAISAAASSPAASPSTSATLTRAPAASDQLAPATGVTRARVTHVVDGDTIDVVRLGGAPLPATRVRFIGVNTPESTSRVEPYGKQAAAYTTQALDGRVVWLTRDVSQTDRYGRSLRYVWLAPPPAHPRTADLRATLFNAVLVLRGYAQVATYPPDVAYAEQLRAFEREARAAGRGLWGIGAPAAAAPEQDSAGSTSGGSGSGGAGGGGAGCDPHYSGGCVPPYPPDLDCSQLDVSGLRVKGEDPHGLDADGDGIACEG
jgi:micrococcal nuclease